MFMEKQDYTAEDIITYFEKTYGIIKTRKRYYLDVRNYLITVLYQKFSYSEERIAKILLIDRSTVSQAKHHTYTLMTETNDQNFLRNIKELSEKFPWTFKNMRETITNHSSFVIHNLTEDEYEKLVSLSRKCGDTPGVFAKKLILKSLKEL